METQTSLVEPLLERAEQYGKTSFELFKLKSLDKTADISSTLISRLLLAVVITLFALTLNTAVALWVGDLLGKSYYGFFVVAGFYGIVAVILYVVHPAIKARVNNTIIAQMLN